MRRLLGTMACLALLATLVSPTLCFMPPAPSPEGGHGSEHDCCRSGLQSTPPACCMSTMAAHVPARVPARLVVEPRVSSATLFAPARMCVVPLLSPFPFLGAPHLKASPGVLRI
jgi:hypothetical protein